MGVLWFAGYSHIHVHVFTTDDESKQLGYTIHEFYCHECARAKLVYADFGIKDQRVGSTFNGFVERHLPCAAKSYIEWSPRQATCYLPVDSKSVQHDFRTQKFFPPS